MNNDRFTSISSRLRSSTGDVMTSLQQPLVYFSSINASLTFLKQVTLDGELAYV